MSVLIKGMEMPTSCHACCFFGQADIWESDFDGYTKSFCERTGSQTFDYVDKFLPNCPLIHVPPHGRLIDADALYREIKAECNPYGKPSIGYDDGLKVLGIIGSTPPVIPAEEEENDRT